MHHQYWCYMSLPKSMQHNRSGCAYGQLATRCCKIDREERKKRKKFPCVKTFKWAWAIDSPVIAYSVNKRVSHLSLSQRVNFMVGATSQLFDQGPFPPSVLLDPSSSLGWMHILDRLVQMNPVAFMYHKSATVWCHPGFLPRSQCDFYIRCHGDTASREENGALTSGLSAGSRARQFIRRDQKSSTLTVCLPVDNTSSSKGETGTVVVSSVKCSVHETIAGNKLLQ